jgi:hypothetical protein
MARQMAMSNSVIAGARKKYFHATTAIATKVRENNATIGLIQMEFDFANDASCQNNTETASRKIVTKSVSEEEVPIAPHRSHHIEGVGLHGLDYRDFFGAVPRRT